MIPRKLIEFTIESNCEAMSNGNVIDLTIEEEEMEVEYNQEEVYEGVQSYVYEPVPVDVEFFHDLAEHLYPPQDQLGWEWIGDHSGSACDPRFE